MKSSTRSRTALAIVTTLVFWASAFAGIRVALEAFSPGQVALLRFAIASLVLGTYALVSKMPPPELRDVPVFLLLGFVGITLYHVPLNYGEVTVTAGSASLLIATGPVVTALLARLFLRETIRAWGWLGILVSFCGAAMIALGEGAGLRLDVGALYILLAAIATSVYFVLGKPYLARYSSLQFTAYAVWTATLTMLVFAPGIPKAIADAPLSARLSVLYLGVFPAAVAYVTWSYALSQMPASVLASFLYLSPILATAIAWLWLREVPTPLALAGGGVILCGVTLVNTLGRAKHEQGIGDGG